MKKILIFMWCLLIVFISTACQENNSDLEAGLSSAINSNEAEADLTDDSNESTNISSHKEEGSSSKAKNSSRVKNDSKNSSLKGSSAVKNSSKKVSSNLKNSSADKGKTSSTKSFSKTNTSRNVSSRKQTTSKVTSSSAFEGSYKDITCVKISSFKKVGFSISQGKTVLQIMMPQGWSLKENKSGYSILKSSKEIGSVTASDDSGSDGESVNLYYDGIFVSGVDIYHSIDRTDTDKGAVYTRTLSYYYEDNEGDSKTLVIKVPYQEIDDSAVWTMTSEVDTALGSTSPNMGTLPIKDNRNKILILGNSFIGTSRIGSILQTMCGSEILVEAQSRGYARVTTYVQDTYVMSSIKSGNYSIVFLCGLYDVESVNNLEYMVNACRQSNTRLVVFPAHNEPRTNINNAQDMHPDITFMDWKSEIDCLISYGIDDSNFCIDDSHKHSTPLAGYVGAHMIYRAIMGKVPTVKDFGDVSRGKIALLGEYASTGTVVLIEEDDIYYLK